MVFASRLSLTNCLTYKNKTHQTCKEHTGKLFQTGLIYPAGAACGEGKLQGRNLSCGSKSTKTLWPPLQERVLHVYKFMHIYISEIGVCTYTHAKIYLNKFISSSKSWAGQAKLLHQQPSVQCTVPIQDLFVRLPSSVWSTVSPGKAVFW